MLLLSVTVAGIVTTLGQTAYGWGRGHRLIRTWAVSRLPAWQRELIADEHWRRLQTDYTSLQDQHAGGKAPHLDRYCTPPVRLSLHDVGRIEASLPNIEWYIEQVLDHLATDQPDEAMKFLGVLCHWNEDPGCPSAHSSPVNEATLRKLLAPPPHMANKNFLFGYGGVADVGKYELPQLDYQPRLLGSSIPEAAARIYQHQRLLRSSAASQIVPLAQACISGDEQQADRIRQTAALANARHIADLLFTLFCLHHGQFPDNAMNQLKRQKLTQWESDATMQMIPHPYYVTPFLVDQALDAQRKLHPLTFAATEPSAEVPFGFGMGTPYKLPYKIGPGCVFDRFTCRVGLHASAGAAGRVAFVVSANGKPLARTKMMSSSDPPQRLEIDLPNTDVILLELQTVAQPGSPSLENLAVWGEPTLHRADSVPLRRDR